MPDIHYPKLTPVAPVDSLTLGQKGKRERMLDGGSEDTTAPVSPLTGIMSLKPVSLTDAVSALSMDKMATFAWMACEFADTMLRAGKDPYGLTRDEIAAVHLYTMPWPTPKGSLYYQLNAALRSRDRQGVLPYFPYLRLLFGGLRKIKRVPGTVQRGVCHDMTGTYPQNAKVWWWGFSSATRSVAVLQEDTFMGKSGPRTLFQIDARDAVNISLYSCIPTEDEALLLPGTHLLVHSVADVGNGLHIVQLKQLDTPHPMID